MSIVRIPTSHPPWAPVCSRKRLGPRPALDITPTIPARPCAIVKVVSTWCCDFTAWALFGSNKDSLCDIQSLYSCLLSRVSTCNWTCLKQGSPRPLSGSITSVTEYPFPVSIGFIPVRVSVSWTNLQTPPLSRMAGDAKLRAAHSKILCDSLKAPHAYLLLIQVRQGFPRNAIVIKIG